MKDSYESIFTSDALLQPLESSYLGSVPMCSECAFEQHCGADPVYHHATQGDFVGHKPSSGYCRRNMSTFKHLLALLQEPKSRDVLMSWIR